RLLRSPRRRHVLVPRHHVQRRDRDRAGPRHRRLLPRPHGRHQGRAVRGARRGGCAGAARLSRRAELLALGRRTQQVLLLAAFTGALVGLAVAGFEWVTNEQLFLHLLRAPQAVRAGAPFVGLALAVLILRTVGHDATSATADEY